jgi:hypothetical protein
MSPGVGTGGSFLGTAAAAAAGTIGGSLLLGSIRSLMGQQGSAHAAYEPPRTGEADPLSGGGAGGDLSRQVGLDDIGRSSSGEAGAGRGYGLLDSSQADHTGVDPEAGDLDAEDFDADADDFDNGDEL